MLCIAEWTLGALIYEMERRNPRCIVTPEGWLSGSATRTPSLVTVLTSCVIAHVTRLFPIVHQQISQIVLCIIPSIYKCIFLYSFFYLKVDVIIPVGKRKRRTMYSWFKYFLSNHERARLRCVVKLFRVALSVSCCLFICFLSRLFAGHIREKLQLNCLIVNCADLFVESKASVASSNSL